MTDKEKKYRDIAREIHDYINTEVYAYFQTSDDFREAIDKIDEWLEQIWLDKE